MSLWTASEVKELTRLLEAELLPNISQIDSLIRLIADIETQNKNLKHQIEEKDKVIADLSFDNIDLDDSKSPNKTTTTASPKLKIFTHEKPQEKKEDSKPDKATPIAEVSITKHKLTPKEREGDREPKLSKTE